MATARLEPRRDESGATLLDLVVIATVIAVVGALAAPAAANVVDASRARQAASFISSRFRLARQEAVARGVNVGVVFDQSGSRWSLRVCRDGTANGLRRVDIRSGADPCDEGPYDMNQLFPGLQIAVDATITGPVGEPASSDPVRFGVADLASFSPSGSCTSGSLFLRSDSGAQYAIRVAGITGRVRVMRYQAAGGWLEQ